MDISIFINITVIQEVLSLEYIPESVILLNFAKLTPTTLYKHFYFLPALLTFLAAILQFCQFER